MGKKRKTASGAAGDVIQEGGGTGDEVAGSADGGEVSSSSAAQRFVVKKDSSAEKAKRRRWKKARTSANTGVDVVAVEPELFEERNDDGGAARHDKASQGMNAGNGHHDYDAADGDGDGNDDSDGSELHEEEDFIASSEVDLKKKEEIMMAKRRRLIPYNLEQMILLVGEGNFSFARALATVLRAGSNITATSLDSLEECKAKYADCEEHIKAFEKLGGTVLHQVDGTKLDATKALRNKTFDIIVFNFPHAGKGIKDQARNIESNRELLLKFFLSSAPKLKKKGEIHVTLRTGMPYVKWNVPGLADRSEVLRLKRTIQFDPLLYPGYAHRNTIGFFKGISKDFNQELTKQNCKTFVFGLRQEVDKVREDQAKAKEAKAVAALGHGKKRRMREAARKKAGAGGRKRRR